MISSPAKFASRHRQQKDADSPTVVGTDAKADFSGSPEYDLAVIGGGPGGYVAAIKAAQLGLNTVCIEKRGTLGGTCLNVGCIPSKALLNITHKFYDAEHNFAKMGIKAENLTLDVPTMQEQKEKCVRGLTVGIETLFNLNKIDYKKGTAKFVSPTNLQVDLSDGSGSVDISAKNFIIATGSESSPMPGGCVVADEDIFITSTAALKLPAAPKKMVIIGGGVIGIEMGSVYARLGTEIIVVEFMDHITPVLDGEIRSLFQKLLIKQGFTFMLSTKVVGARVQDGCAVLEVENVKSGERSEISACKVLLAVGRRPYTVGLGLENIGIERDQIGRIIVDRDLRVPNHPHIMAVGDVVVGVRRAGVQ